MVIVGIDPGLDGALAELRIDTDGRVDLAVHDTPVLSISSKRVFDTAGLVSLLDGLRSEPCSIAIEAVQAFPGQGRSSCFSFGHGMGLWEGILSAFKLPYRKLTPQRWKKLMLAGFPHADNPRERKDQSMLCALQTFPQYAEIFRGARGGSKDGRADAALIAYAHWVLIGGVGPNGNKAVL